MIVSLTNSHTVASVVIGIALPRVDLLSQSSADGPTHLDEHDWPLTTHYDLTTRDITLTPHQEVSFTVHTKGVGGLLDLPVFT